MRTALTQSPERTHIRLEKIVLATDFSQASRAALAYAAGIARQYGAQLSLLHAYASETYPVVPPPEVAWVAGNMTRQDAEIAMARLLESPELAGLLPEGRVVDGDPATVLAELSRDPSLDLLVLGTNGSRGLEKFLMGSVAQKAFLQAECPVLTVGPLVQGEPQSRVAMRTVLYATDFSPVAEAALPYALSFAQEHQSRLILLHVDSSVPGAFSYEQAMILESTRPRLEALVPTDAGLWCQPEVMVKFGHVAEAILEASRENDADIIIMGVRGASFAAGMKAHFAGSTVYKVVREAPCPVLTVRR